MSDSDDLEKSFADYRRTRRVFILGAGFSAAAGIPLTGPLLRRAMANFEVACPGIFERVDNYARDLIPAHKGRVDYSKFSFSDLCTHLEFVELREYGGGERWSHAGSREKLALRFYLAKTIVEHTPSPNAVPELYLQFAEQLSERDIVISFNWDGLLELALTAVGKKYTYNFADDHVLLCKLHGSVNWRLGEPRNLREPINTFGWSPIGFAQGMIDQEIWQSGSLLSLDIWGDRLPLGEIEPFLVLPGYGKAFDVRSNATLWYKPEFYFAGCRDIYVIGLGLAPDDHFIRSFLHYCLPTDPETGHYVYIINPDSAAREGYAFALNGENVAFIQEPFNATHVDLALSRLDVA